MLSLVILTVYYEGEYPMLKTDMVKDYVHNLIREQNLNTSSKLPTEQQLADTLNLSKVTIRRGLAELREQGVLESRRGSGYYVAAPEKGGRKDITYIPFVTDGYAQNTRNMDIIRGASEYLAAHDGMLTVHLSDFQLDKEQEIVRQLYEHRFPSIIVMPLRSDGNIHFYTEMLRQGFPIIFVDLAPSNLCVNLVKSNNFQGGFLAGEYLMKTGCSRPLFVSPENCHKYFSIFERLQGFKATLSAQNIPFGKNNVLFAPIPQLKARLEEALSSPHPPDAIFACNDKTASIVLSILQELGVRIPDDISVIGFDRLTILNGMAEDITTIEQPYDQIGAKAAALALSHARNPIQPPIIYHAPVHLHVGNTTKFPL